MSAKQTAVIPAKAGIQYTAASRLIISVSGILDRPLSRATTAWVRREPTLHHAPRHLRGRSALRIFPPALRAQSAGRALAAAITPVVPRTAFAEIAGVGVFPDQVDQPCPAEIIRQLPGAGLVQPHQRGVQFERLGHAEVERHL